MPRMGRGRPLAGDPHMHFEQKGTVYKSKISNLRQLVIVNASEFSLCRWMGFELREPLV